MADGPYRTTAKPASPRRAWWTAAACLVLGHRWRVRRTSPRARALAHLHPLAGCDAVCDRCLAHWLDTSPPPDLPGYPAKCQDCGRYEGEPCGAPMQEAAHD